MCHTLMQYYLDCDHTDVHFVLCDEAHRDGVEMVMRDHQAGTSEAHSYGRSYPKCSFDHLSQDRSIVGHPGRDTFPAGLVGGPVDVTAITSATTIKTELDLKIFVPQVPREIGFRMRAGDYTAIFKTFADDDVFWFDKHDSIFACTMYVQLSVITDPQGEAWKAWYLMLQRIATARDNGMITLQGGQVDGVQYEELSKELRPGQPRLYETSNRVARLIVWTIACLDMIGMARRRVLLTPQAPECHRQSAYVAQTTLRLGHALIAAACDQMHHKLDLDQVLDRLILKYDNEAAVDGCALHINHDITLKLSNERGQFLATTPHHITRASTEFSEHPPPTSSAELQESVSNTPNHISSVREASSWQSIHNHEDHNGSQIFKPLAIGESRLTLVPVLFYFLHCSHYNAVYVARPYTPPHARHGTIQPAACGCEFLGPLCIFHRALSKDRCLVCRREARLELSPFLSSVERDTALGIFDRYVRMVTDPQEINQWPVPLQVPMT